MLEKLQIVSTSAFFLSDSLIFLLESIQESSCSTSSLCSPCPTLGPPISIFFFCPGGLTWKACTNILCPLASAWIWLEDRRLEGGWRERWGHLFIQVPSCGVTVGWLEVSTGRPRVCQAALSTQGSLFPRISGIAPSPCTLTAHSTSHRASSVFGFPTSCPSLL